MTVTRTSSFGNPNSCHTFHCRSFFRLLLCGLPLSPALPFPPPPAPSVVRLAPFFAVQCAVIAALPVIRKRRAFDCFLHCRLFSGYLRHCHQFSTNPAALRDEKATQFLRYSHAATVTAVGVSCQPSASHVALSTSISQPFAISPARWWAAAMSTNFYYPCHTMPGPTTPRRHRTQPDQTAPHKAPPCPTSPEPTAPRYAVPCHNTPLLAKQNDGACNRLRACSLFCTSHATQYQTSPRHT